MRINYCFMVFVIVLLCYSSFGQNDFESQLTHSTKYKAIDVIDSVHGIDIYERLNFRLSSDSVRNCKGYACNGLIKDFYDDGNVIHQGFYVDGQLNNYTNYYPNGKVERTFKIIDDFKSIMTLFYSSGTVKSIHKFDNIAFYYWEDFYPNGQQSYLMEMSSDMEYPNAKKHWAENGQLLGEIVIENKKDLTFQQNDYHADGTSKIKGHLIYEQKLHSHTKHGKWEYYDEQGKLVKTEVYEHDILLD